MNQLYKKDKYVVVPVGNNFLVINIKKTFEDGHTHVKEMKIARLLIDLAVSKELPKNPYYADNLIRIASDKEYVSRLKEFKDDAYMEHTEFKRMMEDAPVYKRERGTIKRVR